jgi:hypothetical protein
MLNEKCGKFDGLAFFSVVAIMTNLSTFFGCKDTKIFNVLMRQCANVLIQLANLLMCKLANGFYSLLYDYKGLIFNALQKILILSYDF